MKVAFSPIHHKSSALAFSGFKHIKSEVGSDEYEFNFPHDDEKYDAYLEIFLVEGDSSGNYFPSERLDFISGEESLKMGKGGLKVDLAEDLGISSNEPFAYRIKLVDKDTDEERFVLDPGTVIEDKDISCNLIVQSGAKLSKGGSMLLVMPESYNVGWVYEDDGSISYNEDLRNKAAKTQKTFSNNYGGTLAGLEEKIPELEKYGYSRIVSTPFATDDTISSHGYWIRNAMQMSQSLGNLNNYASLQKKMFKSGMNLVADGAFVNEGLEGIHFKDVRKYKEQSPYFDWFRITDINAGPLSLGVFPKNSDDIAFEIINSPYQYTQNIHTGEVGYYRIPYDANEPTKIMIYNKTSDADKSPFDVNNHNDTVITYSEEISPKILHDNIRWIKKYNKANKDEVIWLGSYIATRLVTKTDSTEYEEKFESGIETWDSNTDIAKLRFVLSPADFKKLENLPARDAEEKLEELVPKTFEVQDYAISAAKYWSGKTNDILLEYVAQQLQDVGENPAKAYEKINSLIEDGDLPKNLKDKITPDIVKNVLKGDYILKKNSLEPDYKNLLLSGLMDLPLDSIEFGDDLTATLGYPYITNRAHHEDELGASRYELYLNGNPHLTPEIESVYMKTEDMYVHNLTNFADEIMKAVNSRMGGDKIYTGVNATDLGKYVLPLYGQEIAKFAIIKALAPDIKVTLGEDGELIYDYKTLKQISLADAGVRGENPEENASLLISKIKSGLSKMSVYDKQLLIDSLYERAKNTSAEGYKLAEMIVDRSQAGLDWRIDAAKDIADMDSLRNKNSEFEDAWDDVITFWSTFTKGVRAQNPNSYIAAEITDEGDLHYISGEFGDYKGGEDAVRKFLQQTGITTTANYSFFFTDLAKVFTKGFEDGSSFDDDKIQNQVYDLLVGSRNYLNYAQLESLLYSYTFVGNHDKPRALHCMSLDMELFHSDFEDYEHQKIAASVLNNVEFDDPDIDNLADKIEFSKISNKAIAMGDKLRSVFGRVVDNNSDFNKIGAAIADLAKGSYKGKPFSADAFGVKPFDLIIDMVLKQAEYAHGLELSKEEKQDLANEVFEVMIMPAMSKLSALMKYLVLLPGNPTLFAGDDLGLTGYEEKTKNIYLQNRSFINWDLLNDDNKAFIKDYYENINETMALRSKPELRALNTGTPYVLAKKEDEPDVTGVLRQDPDGAMVISLFNVSGYNHDKDSEHIPDTRYLDSISFHSTSDRDGLPGGLPIGTVFKNIDDDGFLYIVCKDFDKNAYFIKRFSNIDEYYECQKSGNYSQDNEIEINDSAMVLYHLPEEKDIVEDEELFEETADDDSDKVEEQKDPLSFTGKKVWFNPQYRFVSNPYQKPAMAKSDFKILG